jgi:hypothetical protein
MPRSKESSAPPAVFVEVIDDEKIQSDPVLSRAFQLFDGLRKRQVGPDKAAYVVAQFFASQAGSSSTPAPIIYPPVI